VTLAGPARCRLAMRNGSINNACATALRFVVSAVAELRLPSRCESFCDKAVQDGVRTGVMCHRSNRSGPRLPRLLLPFFTSWPDPCMNCQRRPNRAGHGAFVDS